MNKINYFWIYLIFLNLTGAELNFCFCFCYRPVHSIRFQRQTKSFSSFIWYAPISLMLFAYTSGLYYPCYYWPGFSINAREGGINQFLIALFVCQHVVLCHLLLTFAFPFQHLRLIFQLRKLTFVVINWPSLP